jgi:hypothetical protein
VLGFNHSYEISFRYWNGIELVDRPGWPKNFYPHLPTPPVVGDVDGDGAEEIIIGTYNPAITPSTGNLYIYALDGTLKQSIAVPGGLKHIPALASVEPSGRLDVIYRALDGKVYVQNFGATGTNNVSWATHRGNMRRDGNHGVSLYPAGTPQIRGKTSGCKRVSFTWTNTSVAQAYRIFRSEEAAGPFQQVASVSAGTFSYTDYGLKSGSEYFYELGAVYSTNTIHSAPFAILSLLNSNLVANSGFEENDNSHWDKWFTGSIEVTNMLASTNIAYQGKRSMKIILKNQGDNSSIAQLNQYGIPDSTIYCQPGAFYSYGGFFKSGGISQPSEHWLEWSSTKTGVNTNDRPALPYPYYFTPHFVIGTTQADWTYENRTFQLPAGFPNIELRHRYSIAAPGSGALYLDNLFFRQIPSPTSTNWTTLIPFGSGWHYLAAPPVGSWTSLTYNDAAWLSGTAKLGNGSGPQNLVTLLPQLIPNYYFRKKFVLNSTNMEELLLSATCTDINPLRLFLNGVEVKSTLDVVSLQGNEVRYFDLSPFASLLQAGTNIIAAQLSNTWGTDYDDIAFDLRLQAVFTATTDQHLKVQYAAGGNPTLIAETPIGTYWQLQSRDGIAANWQFMQAFTNTTGLPQAFFDTGQNGRALPSAVRSRFYRLVPF